MLLKAAALGFRGVDGRSLGRSSSAESVRPTSAIAKCQDCGARIWPNQEISSWWSELYPHFLILKIRYFDDDTCMCFLRSCLIRF
jgi:hypothetical protein